jgi:membrane-bound ClpP family serine protease
MLGPVAFPMLQFHHSLLILSFVGMTFQIVTAKYAVLFEGNSLLLFIKLITKNATVLGILGISIVIFIRNYRSFSY